MDNIERVQKVAYYIESEPFGRVLIKDTPKGWKNDTKSYERDPESKSVNSKTNIKLEFYGDGAEHLRLLFRTYGDIICRLTKFEMDTLDPHEQMKLSFIQEIDLKTLEYDHKTGSASVDSTEGGLYKDIVSRKDEEYDLKDNYSADGDFIGSLKSYPFTPVARNILRNSLLEASANKNFILKSGSWSNQVVDAYAGIPMEIVTNSHTEDLQNVLFNPGDSSRGAHNMFNNPGTPQRIGDQFILQADRRLTVNLKFHIRFVITDIQENDANNKVFKIQFRVSNGEDIGLDTVTDIKTITNPQNSINQTITVDWTRDNFVIEQGQSLSIVYYSFGDYSGSGSNNRANYYITANEAYIQVNDSTPFRQTTSRCIRIIDAFNRLAAKITGKTNIVKSSLFTNGGELEDVVIDNGFWCRAFPDSYIDDESGEERVTQFVTSWEDLFNAVQYWRPMTWFTKIEGNREVIYVEDARFSQNNFNGIDLGEVDSFNDEAMGENFFKSIEIGMEKDLDYEEINGLDEPNGLSKFTTYRRRAEMIYEAKTPYRIDSVGYELTRRKNFQDYPTEDTDRDEDIWMHDAKRLGDGYTHRVWSDGFSEAPKGIFDPNSAWNLRLSPANRLIYGHSYAINTSLFHYPNKKVRFNSSNANSSLVTYTNGVELKENGEFLISEFDNPTVVPNMFTLETSLTQGLIDQFDGYSTIEYQGDFIQVPNVFGRVKFKYKGEEYYGRVLSIDTEEKVKMELIEVFV